MPIKPLDHLGELQRAVLLILWERGGCSVQEVVDEVSRSRPLAYTTILTTLQNLEKAGWVKHARAGRAYVYSPTRSRDQAGASSLRAFMKRVFAGDAGLLFQTLIENEQLSKDELARLRAMIDATRGESAGDRQAEGRGDDAQRGGGRGAKRGVGRDAKRRGGQTEGGKR